MKNIGITHQDPNSSGQVIKILICLVLIALTHWVFDWYNNQPQDVGLDVPVGKLMSLSFAPYRDGYSPIDNKFPLPEHIDADMELLADKTQTIRTYSVLGGMQPTPEFARKHGVDMILGGWLGDGHDGNRLEISELILTANANPDVVKRIIVGNEVLLRHDMDVETLIAYIRQVKLAVKQPVSYADVWSIYLKYPQLINEVDFVTIHILPYWEDEPVSVEAAPGYVEKIYNQVADKVIGMGLNKPILIGESGWPAAGRQRGLAVPGIVNAATFIRGMIEVSNRNHFDYNIVEAFNQSWKSHHEGVAGANWGLMSADRQPVFPLTGAVIENPGWRLQFVYSTLTWVGVLAVIFKRLQSLSLLRLLLFMVLGQVFAIALTGLAHSLWMISYNQWQRAYACAIFFSNALLAGWLLQRCYHILSVRPPALRLAKYLKVGYLFFMLLALFKIYALALNGRYLSFPTEQFVIPVFGVCGLILCRWVDRHEISFRAMGFNELAGGNRYSGADRLLAGLLCFGVLALLFGETCSFMLADDFMQAHPVFIEGLPFALAYTLKNSQLLNWVLSVLMLALPWWVKSKTNVIAVNRAI